MSINKTQLNKFTSLINKNKDFITSKIQKDDNKACSMAICMSVLEEYYQLSFEDAFDSLTDGSDDCKIDAFYYNSEGNIPELILIQSKYKQKAGTTKTFSIDEIKLCLNTAITIVRGQKLENASPILQEKLKQYRTELKEDDIFDIKVNFYFATNGIICEEHKLLKEIREAEQYNINCYFIDATEFGKVEKVNNAELICNLKEAKNTSRADKTDRIFEVEDINIDGMVASCSASELMKFYEQYGKEGLLESNVRFCLKKSQINKDIEDTFLQNPKKFSFLNNGVTIICTDYTVIPTGTGFSKISMKNPSIINGGQTTSILYNIYKKDEKNSNFNIAGILIRICKAPSDFAIQIAKATNSQNKIDIVDLNANNELQNQIKQKFSEDGIGLLTKRGEDIVYYNDTINVEYLLQLYASLYGDEPAKAKLSKKSIYKKYFDKVFSEETVCNDIFLKLKRCYEISKFLYKKKDEQTDTSFIKHAWYSIIYTMKKLDNKITNGKINFKNLELDQKYDSAVSLLNDIIDKKKDELKTKFSMNNLFKGNEIKDLIDIKIDETKDLSLKS